MPGRNRVNLHFKDYFAPAIPSGLLKPPLEKLDERIATLEQVNDVHARPWEKPPRAEVDAPKYPPWLVYWIQGSEAEFEGIASANVGVSWVGDLMIDPAQNEKVTVANRLDPGDCDNPNNRKSVVHGDIIYIHGQFSTYPTMDSATIKVGSSISGAPTQWDNYPNLAQWNGSDEQTDVYIPLAIVLDMSSATAPRVGRCTLMWNCLGLYQLYPANDIVLKEEIYITKAAYVPNPMPASLKGKVA